MPQAGLFLGSEINDIVYEDEEIARILVSRDSGALRSVITERNENHSSTVAPRWCTRPQELNVASSALPSSWHAEVSGTRWDGWRHCRPVGRVAPSFHASIRGAHAIQVQ
jgi:hypothetical protein